QVNVSFLILLKLLLLFTFPLDCNIASVTSPSASTMKVKWMPYATATKYMLDLRIVNDNSFAPVVVTISDTTTTERLVQGLRPGRLYTVSFKVWYFMTMVCSNSTEYYTVPATPQLIVSKGISSTAINLQWSNVTGATSYLVVVEKQADPTDRHTTTTGSLSAQVDGLQDDTAYNCYVQASNPGGSGGESTVRTVSTLIPPPNGVNVVATGRTSVRISWTLRPGVIVYGVTITRNGDSGATPVTIESFFSYVDYSGLEPCSTYTIGVSSKNNFLEAGEPSEFNHTTSSIGSVTTVSASYSCSTGMATVSWDLVSEADRYRATATGSDGSVRTCNSTSTSCAINSLACGQQYVVTVTAITDQCESISNVTQLFETVPCPPAGLSTYHECASNVIAFSWNATNNTNFYEAISEDENGLQITCRTAATACFFTSATCGQSFSFIVRSVTISGTELCRTPYSISIDQETAPCLPTNVQTRSDCQTGMLVSTWDPTPGAVSHTVEAIGNLGQTFNCSSTSSNCSMPAVPCGEVLSIYITATGSECITERVIGNPAETVPCAPTNFTLVESCNVAGVSLDWEPSNGAIFYIGMAVDSSGNTHDCLSMSSECEITDLQCGTTYDTYVFATNGVCNSTETHRITATTAPCPPISVQATRDCANNAALVSWQALGAGSTYTAVLEDQEGQLLNCTAPGTSCTIYHLECGQNYSVTVQRSDGTCTGPFSSPTYMDSVPCAPEGLLGNVHCDTGALTVSWNATSPLSSQTYSATVSTAGGQPVTCNSTATRDCTLEGLDCGRSYTASVQAVQAGCHSLASQQITIEQEVTWTSSLGASSYQARATMDGHSATPSCTSSGTSCTLPDLLCGQRYNVSVSAVNDVCPSHPSSVVDLQTAPCPPANIQGSVDCASGSASLTWDATASAVQYNGTAVGDDGHVLSCQPSHPTCQLHNLHCGTYYNFTVSATDGVCASPHSSPHRLDSVPCIPSSVSALLNCNTQQVIVNWNQDDQQGVSYIANVTDSLGNVVSTCSSISNTCSLSGLSCGPEYNVTVMAHAHGCSSDPSPPKPISQVNLTQVDIICQSNSADVMWTAAIAGEYTAVAEDSDGNRLNCSSTTSSCQISNLPCGRQYTFSVTGTICHNQISNIVREHSAPCVPTNVAVSPACVSGTASISWNPADGALSYLVTMQTTNGSPLSCNSSSTSCSISDLQCGTLYHVSVTALGNNCNITDGALNIWTVPCIPSSVHASLDCDTQEAVVSWNQRGQQGVSYMANATNSQGATLSTCNSFSDNCTLSGLHCGPEYNVTVTAHAHGCSSDPSPPKPISQVNLTQVDIICQSNSADVMWTAAIAGEYTAVAEDSDGNRLNCSSTTSSCQISNLPCAPCVPTNVAVSPACVSGTAAISWNPADGALSYLVTMQTTNGSPLSCNSSSTSCSISDLQCGTLYHVSVTAIGNNCNITDGALNIWTVPCIPSSVHASLDCDSQEAVVSWNQHGQQGVSYMANATNSQGATLSTCNSFSDNCTLSGLHCGPEYNVTVTAHAHGCSSDPSPPKPISQGSCAVNLTQVDIICQSNSADVMWTAAIAGEYTAVAEDSDGNRLNCSSTTSSCQISNLPCGRQYTFSVTGTICHNQISNIVREHSAPCVPTNVAVSPACVSGTASISWNPADGALSYLVTMQTTNGSPLSCNSSSTSCSISGLQCGTLYHVSVTALGNNCNITDGALNIWTVPCIPSSVHASLDCDTQEAVVSWNQRGQQGVSYMANATNSQGATLSTCNSFSDNCTLSGLHCGPEYNVTVTAHAHGCSSDPSPPKPISQGSCAVNLTQVDIICQSNSADVMWTAAIAGEYTAVAEDSDGNRLNCSSTTSSCQISNLPCGRQYTFSVTGTICHNQISNIVREHSAPCAPTNVAVSPSCVSGTASISWDPADGALSYLVTMQTTNGSPLSCNSSSTSCSISDLQCGTLYHVSVTAIGNNCNITDGALNIWTVPCIPSSVHASLDCDTQEAVVSWNQRGQQGVSYMANATNSQGATLSTCNSFSDNCTLSGLHCGPEYNVTVTAHAHGCSSDPSPPKPISQGSCAVNLTQVDIICQSNSADVMWTAAIAGEYTAVAEDSDGNRLNCSSTTSSCQISNLPCGRQYTFSVTGTICHNQISNIVREHSAPCAPTNVMVTPACVSDMATISWSPADGALSYLVTMETTNGSPLFCNGSSTSCSISDLQCGTLYHVSVTAIGNNCNITDGALNIWTVPCIPSSVHASLDCDTQEAVVSWNQRGQQGVSYMANATNSQGATLSTCNSFSDNCTLSGLHCGPEYNVTVTAHAHGCSSDPSPPKPISQGSCAVNLTQVDIICQSNSADVMWTAAIAGEYTAVAEDSDGNRLNCSSTTSSCQISNLPCGRQYTFSVTGTICHNQISNIVREHSAPCAPTNVMVSPACVSDMATISWDPADGALSYLVTMQTTNGSPLSCNSSSTSCSISDLQCGTLYHVSVTAIGNNCNITDGALNIWTVPCIPSSVHASLDCDTQEAVVSWNQRGQQGVSYMANATNSQGATLSTCNSFSDNCTLSGLHCGPEYNVTVTAHAHGCSSDPSPPKPISQGSCAVNLTQVDIICQSNSADVMWTAAIAGEYTAVAEDSDGNRLNCSSTTSSCQISNLPCGRQYTFSVTGTICHNQISNIVREHSAPCAPTNVMVSPACVSDTATISWNPADGALSYLVTMQTTNGSPLSCNSSSTSCSISDLQCGTLYHVSVTAIGNNCNITDGALNIWTVPCIPSSVHASLDCDTQEAVVSWNQRGQQGVSYMANATNSQGATLSTCNSFSDNCTLSGLHCGPEYNVTVTAHAHGCSSDPSPPKPISQGSCAVNLTQVDIICQSNSADVMWTAAIAGEYTAVAEDSDGNRLNCSSTTSSCQISNLPCGRQYTFSVTGTICHNQISNIVREHSAPCAPTNVMVSPACVSDTATISWNPADGALSYLVTMQTTNGSPLSCNSSSTSCSIGDLQCGTLYHVSVTAIGNNCNITDGALNIWTVPCIPSSVHASLDCDTQEAVVSWNQRGQQGVSYMANATNSQGATLSTCNSFSDNCTLSGLHCGPEYNVTVTAHAHGCSSDPSPPKPISQASCAVNLTQVDVICQSNSADVIWEAVIPGEYTAIAKDADGNSLTCSSNTSSCQISNLRCGQLYTFSVTGTICHNQTSNVVRKHSEPCTPVNETVVYSPPVAEVSWSASRGATYYTAEALTQHGHGSNCSTNATSCELQDLLCGQTYDISITAHNQVCPETTEPFQLETEPCPPQSVHSRVDCMTNTGHVSWERSLNAVKYSVIMEDLNGNGVPAACVTTETFCAVNGLLCGTAYTVAVVAIGSQFNSSVSNGDNLETAPCPPQNATLQPDCEHASATVSWMSSGAGMWAVNYTVTALGAGGLRASCTTQGDRCDLEGLACDVTYNISITTDNRNCDLTTDTGLTYFRAYYSSACVPSSVSVHQPCGSLSATLSWRAEGLDLTYMAMATRVSDDHKDTCFSNTSSCVFDGLDCGELYAFDVSAHGQQCPSNASDPVYSHTAPCQAGQPRAQVACDSDNVTLDWPSTKGAMWYILTISNPQAPCVPADVTAFVECELHVASVSWSESSGDGMLMYNATATASDGQMLPCVTNETWCTWDNLQCGERYTVRVTASDGNCTSPPSNTTTIHMAPCIPEPPMATFDCMSKTASLHWSDSAGAQTYVVRAEAPFGHPVALSTNDTSAQLSELTCGQNYSLTVSALNSRCRGESTSEPTSLQTEPCAPTHVSSSIDCLSNIAMVSWVESNGTEYYTAMLEAGGDVYACMYPTNECSVTSLPCGQSYAVSVTAVNSQCNTTATGAPLTGVPCVPEDVSVEVDCTNSSAVVSWGHSEGAQSYQAFAISSQGNVTCQDNGHEHSCTLRGLSCGVDYSVQVVATGSTCSSTPSQPVDLEPDTVSISWNPAYGALSYRYLVTMEATNGSPLFCNSNSTSCSISGLQCGTMYHVSVTAIGNNCSSTSDTENIWTVPCIPSSVYASLNCITQEALVSWDQHGQQGVSYMANATNSQGATLSTCNSFSENCTLSALPCGHKYNVTVTAHAHGCSSDPSPPKPISQASCAVNLTQVDVICQSNSADVMWEAVIPGEYAAMAEDDDGNRLPCSSNTSSCQISNLRCGQLYTFSVTGTICHNQTSNVVRKHSAPCVPTNVAVSPACVSDTASISWAPAAGALSYLVTMETTNGSPLFCNGSSTSCSISGLQCGTLYHVSVTAIGNNCNSTSGTQNITTVPCVPEDVSVEVDCANSSAVVSWGHSEGAQSYQACAISSQGNVTCQDNGHEHSCTLRGLSCGVDYSVQVVATGSTCSSTPSQPVDLEPAPCAPTNVMVSPACVSDMATISWNPTDGALSYLVTMETTNGSPLFCDSSITSCGISGLQCGTLYHVSVTAIGNNCNITSDIQDIWTVPCVPEDVSVEVDCANSSAVVSWGHSEGADSYQAFAISSQGNVTCQDNGHEHSCTLRGLSCGVDYSVQVVATGSTCSSTPSQPMDLEPAPCAPTNVMVSPACVSDTATISWNPADGALSHLVTMQTTNGSPLFCDSNSTSCSISGLQCGIMYHMSVTAIGNNCNTTSDTQDIWTVPCIPSSVNASLDCDTQEALVSWNQQGQQGVRYMANATNSQGMTVSTCNSFSNNCSLSDLPCGPEYNVTVTAHAHGCSSDPSPPTPISQASCAVNLTQVDVICQSNSANVMWEAVIPGEYTAIAKDADGNSLTCSSNTSSCQISNLHCVPCPPVNLTLAAECGNSTAVLSWAPSVSAIRYSALGQADNGSVIPCDNTEPWCVMDGLVCGLFYTFSVQASDGMCTSAPSQPLNSSQVPCAPEWLQVSHLPAQADMQMLMFAWDPVDCPGAQYEVEITGSIDGDPAMQMEVSSYWTQRTFFELPLPCSSTYSATVCARSSPSSVGPRSAAVTGVTAPCPTPTVKFTGSNTSAVVSWNASALATEYSVYDVSGSNRVEICNTTELSCSVASVASNDIAVTASNDGGESTETSVTHAVHQRRKRDLGVLLVPELTITRVGTDSVRVEWTPVPGASYYTVRVREQLNARPLWSDVATVYGKESDVTGLKPATSYCFSVSAVVNAFSSGVYSEPTCATTGASI
ncbi:uncharacterized protein LOC134465972, partial [Engraulis encrasicolus]|uniref:uncharacterized protein LOC134465972 n=1 Tax=Engraulis encrasicolus TaxID=184585 RepID=UPI002FD2E012